MNFDERARPWNNPTMPAPARSTRRPAPSARERLLDDADTGAGAMLPASLGLTLRAAAAVGARFDAATVAALRESSAAAVLQELQMAMDAGLALEDDGRGNFAMAAELAAALRESTLPSLRAHWQDEIARRGRSATVTPTSETTPGGGNPPAATTKPAAVPERSPAPEPAVRHAAPRERREHSARALGSDRAFGEMFEPAPVSVPMPRSTANTAEPSHLRDAETLLAAGNADAAAERLIDAAVQSAAAGSAAESLRCARRAVAALEELLPTPARRRLIVRALGEMGRTQWERTGPGGDYTLAAALESLRGARALLADGDPPALRATIVSRLAGVLYDLGDRDALTEALAELTEATRALLAAGAAAQAARLLHDAAAVYVRQGDPVRAAHLLQQSRQVFATRADEDPEALYELAHTDHLLARLPLHAPMRPGRETDALAMAREHACAAEEAFERVGAERERARVWETLGRVELLAGNTERAANWLGRALSAQAEQGDVTGLARTTGAMAEVLQRAGRLDEAVSTVGDSVAFNLEKGSRIGLAFNRRALEGLARAGAKPESVAAAERGITAAEEILGRAELADEGGASAGRAPVGSHPHMAL